MIVSLMQARFDSLLARWLLLGTTLIIALVPLHATLTVWLADAGLNYTMVRLWKEALLALLLVGAVVLLFRQVRLRQRLASNSTIYRLLLLISAYVVLHGVAGVVALLRGEVNSMALGYALISNLRFLAFFLVAIIVGTYYADWLKVYWRRLLLWPAMIVVTFGLLQEFVLPYDFLRNFGYGPDTIEPFITVDNKLEYTRLQSTLRGPNPLGAYMVIVVTALAALFITRLRDYMKFAAALTASLVVLFGTYSRSAWIGMVAALGVLAWVLAVSDKTRKWILLGLAVAAVIFAGLLFALRDNPTVQNTVFHTDDTSQSPMSSNEHRAGALIDGVNDVFSEPLGRGPGTAGPASVYNDAPARISESYFVQIGQEVGVAGVMLFVGICAILGWAFWRQGQTDLLALILCASLVGLTIINMISHAWADDTLAYVWWGLAGLAIAPAGLLSSRAGNPASLSAPSTFSSSSARSPYHLYGSLRASLENALGTRVRSPGGRPRHGKEIHAKKAE